MGLLGEPEYVTCKECAGLLGHSEGFWMRAFDAGLVAGHRVGKRRDPRTKAVVGQRMVSVVSARCYLAGLDGAAVVARQGEVLSDAEVMRRWRRSFAARSGAAQG